LIGQGIEILLRFARQFDHQLFAEENMPVSAPVAAIRKRLKKRHFRGPRHKTGARNEFLAPPPQHKVRFLKDITSDVTIRNQCQDVSEQPILTSRDLLNDLFFVYFR